MEEEVIEEYESSLKDLTQNSKPLINMLTMLAEDNEHFAPQIVQVIETHLNQVAPNVKLPTMYLIDSIIKNLPKSTYASLFSHNIVSTFCGVFEKVDEKTRQALYKLRQTWSDIFQNRKLYAIDVRVNLIDPAWPITAQAPTEGSIHVNPKFLQAKKEEEEAENMAMAIVKPLEMPLPEIPPSAAVMEPSVSDTEEQEAIMRQQLISKQQELLKLQQQRLELELAETRAKLETQKQVNQGPSDIDLNSTATSLSMSAAIPPTSSSASLPASDAKQSVTQPLAPRDPRSAARLKTRDPRLANKPPPPSIITPKEPPGIPNIPLPQGEKQPDSFTHMSLNAIMPPAPPPGAPPPTSGPPSFSQNVVPQMNMMPPVPMQPQEVLPPLVGPFMPIPMMQHPVSSFAPPPPPPYLGNQNNQALPSQLPSEVPKVGPSSGSDVDMNKNKQSFSQKGKNKDSVQSKKDPRLNSQKDKRNYDNKKPVAGNSKTSETKKDNISDKKKNENKKEDSSGKKVSDMKKDSDSKDKTKDLSKDFKSSSSSVRRNSPRRTRSGSSRDSKSKQDEDDSRYRKRRDSDEHSNSSDDRRRDSSGRSSRTTRTTRDWNRDDDNSDRRKRRSHDSKDRSPVRTRDRSPVRTRSPANKGRGRGRGESSRHPRNDRGKSFSPVTDKNAKDSKMEKVESQKVKTDETKSDTVEDVKPHLSASEIKREPGEEMEAYKIPKLSEKKKLEKEREQKRNESKTRDMDERQRRQPSVPARKSDSATNRNITHDRDDRKKNEAVRVKDEPLDMDERSLRVPAKRDMDDRGNVEEISEKEGPSTSKKPRLDEDGKVQSDTSALEEDLCDLFGQEDQDYRSMMDVDRRSLPLKSPSHVGWSKYKSDHSGDFSYELEAQKKRSTALNDIDQRQFTDSRQGPSTNIEQVLNEAPQDVDLRSSLPKPAVKSQGMVDPRLDQDSDLRPKPLVSPSDKKVNIPNALSLDRREEILEQIERRRLSGELSHEMQKELLLQLTRLDLIQKQQAELKKLEEKTAMEEKLINSPHKRSFGSPKRISDADELQGLVDKPHGLQERSLPLASNDRQPVPYDNINRPPGPVSQPDRHGPPERPLGSEGPPFRASGPHGPPDRPPILHGPPDLPPDSDGPPAGPQGPHGPPDRQFGPPGQHIRYPAPNLDGPSLGAQGPHGPDDGKLGLHGPSDRPPDSHGPPGRPQDLHGPDGQYGPPGQHARHPGPHGHHDVHVVPESHNRVERLPGPHGKHGPVDLPTSSRHQSEKLPGPYSKVEQRDRQNEPHFDERIPRDFPDDRHAPFNRPFNDNSNDSWTDGRQSNRRGGLYNQYEEERNFRRGSPREDFDDGPEKTRRFPKERERQRYEERDDRGAQRGPGFDRKRREKDSPNFADREFFDEYGAPRQGKRNDFEEDKNRRPHPKDLRKQSERFRPKDDNRPFRKGSPVKTFHQDRDEPRDAKRNMNYRNEPVKKVSDPRWQLLGNRPPEQQEEFVIDGKPYNIHVGEPPKRIPLDGKYIEVFADPNLRAITVDGKVVYKFGDSVKDFKFINKHKVFYHGLPRNIWIDGTLQEVRVDAPPKFFSVGDKRKTIKIDGRDNMIIIDKKEYGPCGGPPRFEFIDDFRCELRFDPPPRQILIDGKLCELKLDREIPCIIIDNVPHGIRFDGPPRNIIVNDTAHKVPMDKPLKMKIYSRPHYIAFGGPAHEVILDGKWYEVKFGGPPKDIVVGQRKISVRLEGNPPDVKILEPIKSEIPPLGPPPLPPGQIRATGPGQGMIRPNILPGERMIRPDGPPGDMMLRPPGDRMAGPPFGERFIHPGGPGERMMHPDQPRFRGPMDGPMVQPPHPGMMESRAPGMQPIRPEMMPLGPQGQMMPMGMMLPNQMPQNQMIQQSQMGPRGLMPMGGQVSSTASMSQPGIGPGMQAQQGLPFMQPQPSQQPIAPVDVNSLLQSLLKAGIIQKPEEKQDEKEEEEDTEESSKQKEIQRMLAYKQTKIEEVPDISNFATSKLKKHYKGVIQRLYAGIQCASCGTRFTGTQTEKYREHLDWHFRQNRKDKEGANIAKVRKWYYEIKDWIQYEEIDESEERVRSSVFEKMATDAPVTVKQEPMFTIPSGPEIVHCPAATGDDDGDICVICGDPFEQFWDEEAEEWHLRDAVKSENKTYHPVCYEDAREEGSIADPTPTPTPAATPTVNPLIAAIRQELGEPVGGKIAGVVTVQTGPVRLELDSDEADTPTEDEQDISSSENVSINETVVKQEPATIKSELGTSESVTVKVEPAHNVIKTEPESQPVATIKTEPDNGLKSEQEMEHEQQITQIKTEPSNSDAIS